MKSNSKMSDESLIDKQNQFQINEKVSFNYAKLSEAGNTFMRIYYAVVILILFSLLSFLTVFYLAYKGESIDITNYYYLIGIVQILFLIITLSNLKAAAKNLKNSVTIKLKSNHIIPISDFINQNEMIEKIAQKKEKEKRYSFVEFDNICPACSAEFKNIYVEKCPKCGLKFN